MYKQVIPKLRFPEFGGMWEVKKFGDIAKFIGGGTPSTKTNEYWRGEVPWISSSDLIEGDVHRIKIHRFITEEAIKSSATKIIPAGSVLIVSRVGVGKVAINKVPLCTSQDFQCAILTSADKIFIAYLIQFKAQKFTQLNQGTSIKGVVKEDLNNLPLSLPLLSEQTKIADFLTVIDDYIQKLTKKKVLLEQYKKGLMQQIFSQKIRFKADNGNDYQVWEIKKIKEAVTVNPITKQKLPAAFNYIDLESVENGVLNKTIFLNIKEAPSRAQRLLQKNDILYQMVRPYQKNNLFFDLEQNNYVASTGYAQLRTVNNPQYIYQYLHTDSFVNDVMLRCTGTSYPAINSTDLSDIKILLPSLPEQTKIAKLLTVMDEKIRLNNTLLEQSKLFKKAMLQQLFV